MKVFLKIKDVMKNKILKTKEEWKKILNSKEFYVLREKGTERPFSGKYVLNKDNGIYICAGCGNELFSSDMKFDSGSGWPSFWDIISKENIELKEDNSFSMHRVEVICSNCGGHLGHVFDDGPRPTGKRYCINSASLHFQKKF